MPWIVPNEEDAKIVTEVRLSALIGVIESIASKIDFNQVVSRENFERWRKTAADSIGVPYRAQGVAMANLFSSRIVPPDFTLEEGPPNFTGPWNKIAGPETFQRILDALAHIKHECQADHSYRILCSGNVVLVHDPLNPDGHWIDDGHGGLTLVPLDEE